jgi:HSP20 family protein
MDEMMHHAFGTPIEKKKHKPYVLEASVTEPDGNQSGEQHVPLVDVIEEEREVVIVAELPGVKKEDVQIRATKGNVTISVDTVEFKYHKGLALPVETNPGSAVATYKNGVLQIRLKKLTATQPFTI